MKPGPGWEKVGPSVYDHPSGLRIHVGGYCLMPQGEFISGNAWPQSSVMDRFIRIAGGNRRRGVMMWALSLIGITVRR